MMPSASALVCGTKAGVNGLGINVDGLAVEVDGPAVKVEGPAVEDEGRGAACAEAPARIFRCSVSVIRSK